jgi:hypothetical protein
MAVFGSHVLYLFFRCWLVYPYDGRGFVGAKKKMSVDFLVFNSSMIKEIKILKAAYFHWAPSNFPSKEVAKDKCRDYVYNCK